MTISGTQVMSIGASYHMTNDSSMFFSCSKPCNQLTIHTVDGSPMPIQTIGSLSTDYLSPSVVLYVPQISINLIYVS